MPIYRTVPPEGWTICVLEIDGEPLYIGEAFDLSTAPCESVTEAIEECWNVLEEQAHPFIAAELRRLADEIAPPFEEPIDERGYGAYYAKDSAARRLRARADELDPPA